MAARTLKRFVTGIGPVLAFVLLLLVSLLLMSNATQGSAHFGQLYSVLLVINALGLIALAGLIVWNLFTLLRQVRRDRAGARLTVRMVAVFVILSVTPVLVVYYFSLQFLHRGIDSWFDVRIERALDDALELSRTALGVRMRELLSHTEVVAGDLVDIPADRIAIGLDDNRRLSGASEFTLIGANGHIIASSSRDPTAIVPHRPSDTILVQLRQSGNYIGLDPIGDAGLHVRVVVRLPENVSTAEPRILQALYPVAERTSALAETVQSTYAKYRELAYLRKPLKTSFTLTLSLVLLLSLFAAVWAAFYSARRLVAPLRDLAMGTRAVADGDYETQLTTSGEDEVGFLVESFNDMTRRLARARDETRRSQQQVEDQRRYLETTRNRGRRSKRSANEIRTCNHWNRHCRPT
jgi:nitrogen fixation/metabolism regulation signal transduction histidine kinase